MSILEFIFLNIGSLFRKNVSHQNLLKNYIFILLPAIGSYSINKLVMILPLEDSLRTYSVHSYPIFISILRRIHSGVLFVKRWMHYWELAKGWKKYSASTVTSSFAVLIFNRQIYLLSSVYVKLSTLNIHFQYWCRLSRVNIV